MKVSYWRDAKASNVQTSAAAMVNAMKLKASASVPRDSGVMTAQSVNAIRIAWAKEIVQVESVVAIRASAA